MLKSKEEKQKLSFSEEKRSRNLLISAPFKEKFPHSNRLIKLWNTVTPYCYLLPGLLIFCVFVIYPLFRGLSMSFYDISILAGSKKFIGFDNYYKVLFEDPIFWIGLRNNIFYVGSNIFFEVGLGLFLASLLDRKRLKGAKIFRTIYLIPFLIPLVGTGILFKLVFNTKFGLINGILKIFGLSFLTRSWLAEMPEALISVFSVSVWVYLGTSVILFLSAMQRIPREIYESAEIDGINSFQRFTKITLPLIKEMITVVVGLTIIASFTEFALFYVITAGGPLHKTEVMATWMIRNAFFMDNPGYGAAISVMLLIIVLIITYIFMYFRGKETYEY